MDKKLIVISIDSFVTEDLGILRTLPHFARVLDGASLVLRNRTTYPSLTHSVHTSIQTGCNPGRHGVVNNEHFCPYEKNPPWFDDAADIRVPTLWQECARQLGTTTALVFWPLCRGAQAQWVIARPGVGGPHREYADAEDELRRNSTPGIYTGALYERCHSAWELPHYYDWDEFSARACAELISEHEPDVLMTHWTVIDAERHRHGVFSPVLRSAYEALDRGLGYILDALDEKNLWDRTVLAITSDHGHLDIRRVCRPNVLLERYGLLRLTPQGELSDYSVFCHGSGLCCPVYLKDPDEKKAEMALRFFRDHQSELGFSEILLPDELSRLYGLRGDFSFILETDGETGFLSDWTGPLFSSTTNGDYRGSRASHGHRPEKGVQPCLILRDPNRKHPVCLENGRIIDQAPTFAALLGAVMPQADGHPMTELLG